MTNALQLFLIQTSPIGALLFTACTLIGLECLTPLSSAHRLKLLVASMGVLGALGCVYLLGTYEIPTFSGAGTSAWLDHFQRSYQLDSSVLCLFSGLLLFTLIALFQVFSRFEGDVLFPEILILILFITSGMCLLVSSTNLLMVFLSLEFLSLPTYVLVGLQRKNLASCEAALKYFLIGSFATVLLTLGIALLYFQFGTLEIARIGLALQTPLSHGLSYLSVLSALALLIIAVGFKVGAVPFHMWVPDTYQGAATPITAFMGSAIKLAGFSLVVKILWGIFLPISPHWIKLVATLAVLTMFVGNLSALVQNDLKRLFAYSSISHAGYLFLALASVTPSGVNLSLIAFYLLTYGFMFLGFFGVLLLIEKERGNLDIHQLSGLGFSHPFLGFCLAFFSLSAAGIPPTAGFFAKYFIFLEAIHAGNTFFVILGALSSAIGAYYYLRIIVHLYLYEPRENWLVRWQNNRLVYATIAFCLFTLFYFALSPESTIHFSAASR